LPSHRVGRTETFGDDFIIGATITFAKIEFAIFALIPFFAGNHTIFDQMPSAASFAR
jgi:hypothetical protein